MAARSRREVKFFKKNVNVGARPAGIASLSAASFLCGMCVMVLEMAGSRVVAPYMGTSLIVWTSLIGIIMASLTLGYWLGGRIADRRPEPWLLARIIISAAVVTALVGIWANTLLSALASGAPNVYVGSVVASLCLFALPSALLGAVSPFIVRLAMNSLVSAGATVGRFSALSSAGSILGTFLGGFVLISIFSSRTILFLVAAVLATVALLLQGTRWKVLAPVAILSVCLGILSEAGVLPVRLTSENARESDPYRIMDIDEIDTPYNSIKIMELSPDIRAGGRKVRILQTDPMGAQSLMYIDNPPELFSDYTKFYDLAFHYRPDAKSVLMLGGGGYCVPRHITATRPDVSVDIVELDSGVTDVARMYFNLTDRPGQTIYHEDARQFLNREARSGERKYDAIFEDVFGSSYNIPFHMTTAECMARIRELLAPDGVFVVNIISSIDGELFSGIYSSIAASFPVVMIFPATNPNSVGVRQNVMILALASETVPDAAPENDYIAKLLAHRWTRDFSPKISAFTDAFAPVERYSLRL
ncbi:MAG: fused MFS/spermidine synthase [Synergistaceae bacterium]|jgi:spermidine synthase/MFS family permease|nr:fused MFS/spermidine synthase [Synergistaceae bacterium]